MVLIRQTLTANEPSLTSKPVAVGFSSIMFEICRKDMQTNPSFALIQQWTVFVAAAPEEQG